MSFIINLYIFVEFNIFLIRGGFDVALAKIIKYEGDNTTFVWKSPIEDFNTLSQLIVHQAQEAVFFKNGQALDLFTAGKYTLKTQNIPILKRILNLPTGGKTPFHCEVYFINKTQQMAIKWGTDSQVQYMEPKYKFPLMIGASGEMTLSVSDSRKLLVKIVGTETNLTQNVLVQKFRAYLMSKIKPYIASTMQSASFSIFEVDAHMEELSKDLKEKLVPDFKEYGISLDKFFVTTIAKPDGETAYEKFKDLHIRQYSDVAEAQLKQQIDIIEQQTEAQKLIIESQAIAKKREQEGYTYQQERGFDVAQDIAQNESSGDLTGLGVGLGMMGGVAKTVGGIMDNALGDTTTTATTKDNSMEAFKNKLEKLKLMKESGILSDEEFAQAKLKLLENI